MDSPAIWNCSSGYWNIVRKIIQKASIMGGWMRVRSDVWYRGRHRRRHRRRRRRSRRSPWLKSWVACHVSHTMDRTSWVARHRSHVRYHSQIPNHGYNFYKSNQWNIYTWLYFQFSFLVAAPPTITWSDMLRKWIIHVILICQMQGKYGQWY